MDPQQIFLENEELIKALEVMRKQLEIKIGKNYYMEQFQNIQNFLSTKDVRSNQPYLIIGERN